MPRTLPTIRFGLLHTDTTPPLAVSGAAWRRWLDDANTASFRFEEPPRSFTARRETIRGREYWYGYRKIDGKLRKVYLGKAGDLTLERLQNAAGTLERGATRAGSYQHTSSHAGAEQSQLLTTKLITPPLRSGHVSRRQLTDRLDAALQHALTLVVAPPGSGKSTLVSEWVHALTTPSTWLTLDVDDNDPQRFWSYLLSALEPHLPSIHDGLATAHRASPAIGAELARKLVAAPAEIVLVLDDYHTINEPVLQAALAQLLTYVPRHVHLVLISRSEPQLPISRLRVRDLLLELGAPDLRFGVDEAATFFAQNMAVPLSETDVRLLVERTEGWIAGLHLAALALGKHHDRTAALSAFGGRHRYVLDYLADEVLQQQPAWVQTFLLHTAILDRLSAPLCTALLHDWIMPSGTAEDRPTTIQAMLEWIERANLFLVPLDSERRWYRYHTLFADFLRTRLHELAPSIVPDLHRRASDWYARHGLAAAAIDHALAGADWEQATVLISTVAQPMLLRGETATLLRWLDVLPSVVVQRNVRLSLLFGWALVIANQIDDLDARLQALETNFGPGTEAALLGEVMALRSAEAAIRGDFTRAIALAQPALECLPVTNLYRSTLGLIVGGAAEFDGDFAGAAQQYAESAQVGRSAGNLVVDATASCSLAGLYVSQGRLRAALEAYQGVLQRSSDASGTPLPVAGMALLGLSDLHYQWNELAAAEASLEQGRALAETWADPELLTLYQVMQIHLELARGDTSAALAILETLDATPLQAQWSWMDAALRMARVRFWLASGDIAAAAQWAQRWERELGNAVLSLRDAEYAALVQVYLAQGSLQSAQNWLDRLLPIAEHHGRWSTVIELLALQALVADAAGNTRSALAALRRSISIAAAEHPIRVFVDRGPTLVPLLLKLRTMQRRGVQQSAIALAYIDAIVVACQPQAAADAPTTPLAATVSPLIEPLSARECDVLRLLAEGLENRAIADKLVIAPSTVKRHLLNMYRKLDVHSRVAALARARTLDLLR